MTFDLLVHGGKLIDGTGSPWRRADVGIRDGRIAAVGSLPRAAAGETIDAADRFVCPGFIDVHSHTELAIMRDPAHMAHVAQGVTTDITGMCGLSVAPASAETLPVLTEYLAPILGDYDLGRRALSVSDLLGMLDGRSAVNVGYLAPHATLRIDAVGMTARPPEPEEVARVRFMLDEAMQQGALGLSVGLTYFPSHTASLDELISLCEVVSAHGGMYSTHLRSYSDSIEEAIDETVEIGRRARIPVHVAHLRMLGQVQGKAEQILSRIDDARASGVDITFDCYPYLLGCTLLACFMMPAWFFEGGTDASLARLEDEGERARLRHESTVADWDKLTITAVGDETDQTWVGKTVAEIAEASGSDPFDACCDLLRAARLRVTGIGSPSDDEDLCQALRHPAGMMGSDTVPVGTRPHPRAYGTFSRFLATYVRDRRLMPLEEAIRKATSFSAQTFGLLDRGVLRPGMAADVVVIDFEGLEDMATYENPQQSPTGIEHVIVNGRTVVRSGNHTGELPGRALRLA